MNNAILKKILLIILLSSIIFGVFFKDFYPIDEWRYVVITKDLDKSFLKLTYAGQDYFEKPPFYFWLLYISAKIFGFFNLLSFKLPNIVAAVLFMLVFAKILRNFVKDYYLFLLIFFSLPLNFVSIQLVRMDFLMNLFINLAIMIVFNRLYFNAILSRDPESGSLQSKNLKLVIFFSGFLSSLAVLIKGPAGFFIPFVVIFITLVLERQFRIFYILCFLAGFVILIFLWFLGGYLLYGKQYLESYILKETAGRIIYGKHHNENIFYYFLLFIPVTLPYSLILIANVKKIYKSKYRIFVYWILVSLIVLSLSKSKLIIYLSSLMLPISIILCEILENATLNARIESNIKLIILLFVSLFLILLLFNVGNSYIANSLSAIDTKIVLVCLIVFSVYFLVKKLKNIEIIVWWVIAITVISIFLYYKLNRHYDIYNVTKTIKQQCSDRSIFIYKWRTLYYLKWKMKDETIKFTEELPQNISLCAITSYNIYSSNSILADTNKKYEVIPVPFSRDGGIVIIRVDK